MYAYTPRAYLSYYIDITSQFNTTINIKRFIMRRFITFIALLTCFLGAKAEWVEDYRIDYQDYSGFPFYVMGYVPEWVDGIMTDYGAMYAYKTELEEADSIVVGTVSVNGTEYQKVRLAEPKWHQYFIADGIPTEVGGSYTVRAKVRASEPCQIQVSMKWGWGADESIDIPIYIDSEWMDVEWTVSGIGGTLCNIVAQPGSSTATIEWEYLAVGHEKDEEQQPPVELEQIYSIAYPDYSGFPFYVMSYVPEWNRGIMTDYGAMYIYRTDAEIEEATANEEAWISDIEENLGTVITAGGSVYNKLLMKSAQWHQYMIADGIPTELDGNYIVRAKVRASDPCTINVKMQWGWGNGQSIETKVAVGTEWQDVEWAVNGIGGTSCTLIAQPGSSTATIEWEYVTISREKKDQPQVEWVEMLTNGDAEKPWRDPNLAYNADNSKSICAWAKQKGTNLDEEDVWRPFPANIEEDADSIGNHVFVVHAATADSEDGAAAWDNQFWIQSPQVWTVGTQVKIHFRYKASRPATTATQTSGRFPGDYIVWHAIGDIEFTEAWQEYDGVMTIADDMAGSSAIAFNLNNQVTEPTDFYFDDLSWQVMKLDEGYFISGINTNTTTSYNDLNNAVQFEGGGTELVATFGVQGDENSYVDQVMISTKRGDDQSFRGATLRPEYNPKKSDPDEWIDYAPSSNYKIDLPGLGVWRVYLDPEYNAMAFVMLEGIPYVTKPVDIVTNTTEVTVHGQEREYTETEAEMAGIDIPDYPGQPWDNHFFLFANRPLNPGEVTVIKFQYKANKEANTTTQLHAAPGAYVHWAAIGDVYFTEEWQDFEYEYTIPNEAEGKDAQCVTFNMAVIKEACDYELKNFQWYVKYYDDATKAKENLIDAKGTQNFYVKEGAGNAPRVYGTVVDDAALWTNNATVRAGEGKGLPVYLKSSQNIVGLQFDVALPDGIDFNGISLYGYNTRTHSVSYNELEDGTWRCVVVSQDNDILSTEDEVLYLNIYANDWMEYGSYGSVLMNAVLTTSDKQTLRPEARSFVLTVTEPYTMGDVNGDGYINVTDVVLIIDEILQRHPNNFIAEAADVNFDGDINVTDVVIVIDAILGKTTLNRAAVENDGPAGVIEMPAQTNLAGDVAVSLTNPTAYTAFQMDVTLPMGVSLEKAQLTGRTTDSHMVNVSKTGEGRYRIVGFSMENEPLNGNSGDLLNMNLQSNGQASGTIAINNVIFVTPEGTQHELAGIESFGGTTGIVDVRGDMSDVRGDIFDLQGRKVNGKTSKGVYIINGKKQITK